MKTRINRRQFVSGAAALAGTAAIGALVGCSAGSQSGASQSSQGDSATEESIEVVETLEADVVVVGAGISGLAAAVQAAQLGMSVVQLEANTIAGGNGQGTEGIFAIGSKRQQELGIKLTLADIVSNEQDFFKYKVNALCWKDMVEQSADTIDWLMENGVEFSGTVDNYPPLGSVNTMHWWKDGKGSSYINPMVAKAKELGVDLRLSTRGYKLVIDEKGSVTGIVAKAPDGDIQINAPAIILASGGFADSDEKLAAAGVHTDEVFVRSFGGHNGDGLDMAIQAGARDLSMQSGFLRETTIRNVDFATPFSMFFFTNGSLMWVNQEGERFADENCLSITSGCQSNANSNQDQTYSVFSQAILDAAGEEVSAACAKAIADGNKDVATANTLEELAATYDIPAAALRDALDRYNSFCDAGSDDDFGKDATKLVRIDAPYYVTKMSYCYMSSIGGIRTDRKAQVISASGTVVPGLYAVGSDGCELYAGTYTISVCGSYNGNNVYSGRNAARNALEYVSGR